jgi:HAD superfamily hydrolase (TIGR01549 family)
MVSIKAVLFDLGNTLTNDISLTDALIELDNTSITNDLKLDVEQLMHLGKEIDKCIANLYIENSLNQPPWFELWQQASVAIGLELSPVEIENLCHTHLQQFVRGCTLKSYCIPLLIYLKEKKIPLALVSNMTGPVAIFDKGLDDKGVVAFFDTVVWSSAIGLRKPDNRVFEYTIKQLNLKASKGIWMVGDNEQADIVGGKAMGFTTVKVIMDIQNNKSAADYVVEGGELIKLFSLHLS